jgi:hypothetical protein
MAFQFKPSALVVQLRTEGPDRCGYCNRNGISPCPHVDRSAKKRRALKRNLRRFLENCLPQDIQLVPLRETGWAWQHSPQALVRAIEDSNGWVEMRGDAEAIRSLVERFCAGLFQPGTLQDCHRVSLSSLGEGQGQSKKPGSHSDSRHSRR